MINRQTMRVFRTMTAVPLVAAALGLHPVAADIGDEPPLVVITGGADFSGHAYTWNVTNNHDSPIVSLAFPQHGADLFVVPDSWAFSRNGSRFLAEADRSAGIAPHEESTFEMRVSPRGAKRGRGAVTVQFADGAEFTVREVELPVADSSGDRFVGLIGLGIVLGTAIIYHRMRSRGKRTLTDP